MYISSENEKSIRSFLNHTLQSEDFKIQPLIGDASQRKYYRITSLSKESHILMVCDPFDSQEDYSFLSVQRHFLKNGVNVPKVINTDSSHGMILLEDLDDQTLEKKSLESKDTNLIKSYYQKSLEELAKIHYKSTEDKADFSGFRTQFNTESFVSEMNFAVKHLLNDICKFEPDAQQAKNLSEIFKHICEQLDKEPKFICHRDYHSRNLMLKDSKIYVIDFQDARMGPIQYDLVSLLRDSYVHINPETERELLIYYLNLRKTYNQPSLNLNHFYKIYELQTIQRCFKACGSFASFYNLRGDKGYIKYLPPTLKKVEKSLSQFPEYRSFQSIINMVIEELNLPL